jgi:hypothetical protein
MKDNEKWQQLQAILRELGYPYLEPGTIATLLALQLTVDRFNRPLEKWEDWDELEEIGLTRSEIVTALQGE